MRLVGGAITIALERDSANVGLLVAAMILLNVGVVPLIMSTLGMLRVLFVAPIRSRILRYDANINGCRLMDKYGEHPNSTRFAMSIRISLVGAAALLAAGGGVAGENTQSSRHLGRILALLGYILFAAVLAILLAMGLWFWTQRFTLKSGSRTVSYSILRATFQTTDGIQVLYGILTSAPFLVVRNIYGILEVVLQYSPTSIWDPVYGSAVAFATMALLMEYIIICVYLYVGFVVSPNRRTIASALSGEASESRA